jgi:histidinol-phosphate aminotransferase
LNNIEWVNGHIRETVAEKKALEEALKQSALVERLYPSDANFVLARVNHAPRIYDFLVSQGIIVRDRSRVVLCEGCLRITVGTPSENEALLKALNKFTA